MKKSPNWNCKFFILPKQNVKISQLQLTKQSFARCLIKKLANILLVQILTLILNLLHVSVQAQAQQCPMKALPRRFGGQASTGSLVSPATKTKKARQKCINGTTTRETRKPTDEFFNFKALNNEFIAAFLCLALSIFFLQVVQTFGA